MAIFLSIFLFLCASLSLLPDDKKFKQNEETEQNGYKK